MVTWNNKLVTFLSAGNSIKFESHEEFERFKSLMRKIGLDFSRYYFEDLVDDNEFECNRRNKPCTIGHALLVSYDNGRGFQFGWSSEEESQRWYELKPFTWKEVEEEFEHDRA